MIAAESAISVTILPVSVAAIFDAPNSADLFRANAEECLVPDAQPQFAIYSAMEQAGVLHCFAAYAYSDPDNSPRLVGFCSVLTAVMPHTGKLLATGESIFVDPSYRNTGAGEMLTAAAEQYADSIHAPLSWLPRAGSVFDKVLSRRAGYTLTHSQHTRRLA